MRVLPDAHDASKTHGPLVDGLQEICRNHDAKYSAVDHLAEFRVLLLWDVDAVLGGILGHFLVHLMVVCEASLLVHVDVLESRGALHFVHVPILVRI